MKHLNKLWLLVFLLPSFSACGGAIYGMANALSSSTAMQDQPAPELYQGRWLNSDALSLASLSGKVVLLDFWRRSCPHCRKMSPQLQSWYKTYGKSGLAVIGIHTPNSKEDTSFLLLQQYVLAEDVSYPIMTDNSGKNWENFKMEYWPTIYLIDRKGIIRYVQVGAGKYEETEAEIKKLLAE